MSEFRDLANKAEDYAQQHPDQVDKGMEKAEGFAEEKTGHQHDDQIEKGFDAAEQRFGGGQGQDQQGGNDGQDQQQGW